MRAKGEKVAEGKHGGAGGEHERAQREHERASKEQGGAPREHMAETGLSARAIRQYYILETRGYYIYIIYTPNLGWGIAVLGRKREQGRLRGSIEGARGRSKGALGEHGGAMREQEGAEKPKEQIGPIRGVFRGSAGRSNGSLKWLHPYQLELALSLLDTFSSPVLTTTRTIAINSLFTRKSGLASLSLPL